MPDTLTFTLPAIRTFQLHYITCCFTTKLYCIYISITCYKYILIHAHYITFCITTTLYCIYVLITLSGLVWSGLVWSGLVWSGLVAQVI